nr:TonB-dependent receptor plug domain-containing protein [Flavobacterium sp. F-126]
MEQDQTTLQEVRINTGYYSVKEKERTDSIAKIKAADIEKQPVNNPLAAMQGHMAGVNITQNTGVPGGGFNIQIRGLSSIRGDGNDPLYIVNGVPYSSQSLGDATVSASAISGVTNPLNNLNVSDIENIEVLKDADATAIYGSRGANGVVLITTKKGRSGETRFNLNAFTAVGKVARKMDLMQTSQYLSMRAEAFANDGITEYPEGAYDINGTWDQNRNADWQKELKEYLLQGELSLISMKEKSIIRETERLMNALWTGLTKIGLNYDLYFEKVDEFIR